MPNRFGSALLFALASVGLAHAQVEPLTRAYSPAAPAGNAQTRAAARNSPTSTTPVVPEDFAKLLLAPGFLLDLQVYDMPEISSELRIDSAGDIEVPLAGKAHLAGLTLPQARECVSAKLLDSGILLHPRINLDVIQYSGTSITVLGEVQSPGRLPLLAPHSLNDVLAMAGGESQLAGNTVEISHPSGTGAVKQSIHYDRRQSSSAGRDVAIEPGDTVLVPRAGIVYVLGGVNRPGGYLLQEDGTLDAAGALSVASGTTHDAAVGSMRIVRRTPDGSIQTFPVAYRKWTEGREVPPKLQDGDILYVPVSKVKTVLSAGIASSASSALIYSVR